MGITVCLQWCLSLGKRSQGSPSPLLLLITARQDLTLTPSPLTTSSCISRSLHIHHFLQHQTLALAQALALALAQALRGFLFRYLQLAARPSIPRIQEPPILAIALAREGDAEEEVVSPSQKILSCWRWRYAERSVAGVWCSVARVVEHRPRFLC